MNTTTTITITDVVSSVVSIQFGDIELTRWSDGSITIEDPAYQFTGDEKLFHAKLDVQGARNLAILMRISDGKRAKQLADFLQGGRYE